MQCKYFVVVLIVVVLACFNIHSVVNAIFTQVKYLNTSFTTDIIFPDVVETALSGRKNHLKPKSSISDLLIVI